MAVEYARNQGTQNFMEDLIGEFRVRYPGAIPPSRMTVYRQFMKLEHLYSSQSQLQGNPKFFNTNVKNFTPKNGTA